jgi:6,7-dimethyl-8-ribityllumazine synthase
MNGSRRSRASSTRAVCASRSSPRASTISSWTGWSPLLKHGVDAPDIEVVRVPGAFEIPLAVKKLAQRGRHDGIVALGCVIRGATPHFDYVAGEASRGIAAVSLEHGIPVGFGILTVETIEQATERAGTKGGNKGADAALAAIQMVTLLRELEA